MAKSKPVSIRIEDLHWQFFSEKEGITSMQEGVDRLFEMYYYAHTDKNVFNVKVAETAAPEPIAPTVVEKVAEVAEKWQPPVQKESSIYNNLISKIPTSNLPAAYNSFVRGLNISQLKLIYKDLMKAVNNNMSSRGAENVIPNIQRRIRKNL